MPKLLRTVAIAQVFPEGQKTTAFAMEYDCEIDLTGCSVDSFSVVDYSLEPQIPASRRKIIRVYTNAQPCRAEAGRQGRYVILETDPDQKEAFSIVTYNSHGEPDPFAPGPLGYKKPGAPEGPPPGGPPKKPGQPGPSMGYCGPKPLRLMVSQLKRLNTTDGRTVPISEAPCTESVCAEVDRFQLFWYDDLPYNLYIPEGYDGTKAYPLVLFIPDAGGRGADTRTPMLQGIGGTVWTSPEDQAKHPCFVVCPSFGPEDVLTHDDFTCLPKLYKVKNILDEITEAYNIDRNRIYTTGQSMGCMSSCELMNTYPGYFAGALLVAGQWDPVRCGRTMWDQNLWILVSCNDLKAHPGMDAVTAAIEENGGKVARFQWDGSADGETLNACVAEALKAEANVRYTLFEGSTVVPPGQNAGPGSNHTNTWRVAYQISALRDWLFTNRKN